MEFIYRDILVIVTKKKMKNMYLRIREPEGNIQISAPWGASQKQIQQFIENNWEWIVKKREEVMAKEQKEYVTGEKHSLWGQEYKLFVERSLKKPMTELRGDEIYLRVTAHSTVEERRKQLDKWYKEQLKKEVEKQKEHWEFVVGKQAKEWTFRRMKTRWGSCHVQKEKICLNIQLAEKPYSCLEYVMVHELTHLHETGHNKRFWGLMDKFYPSWRLVKKQLNN